jgi:probable F420-dependent oxidoreductase
VKFSAGIPGNTLYTDAHAEHGWEAGVTTSEIVAMAQAADDLGYDFLALPTHFVMDTHVAKTMGPRWTHSLSMAGFVLGATKRIRVLCLVVVPNHNPVELAKALATLDWASGGRLVPVPMVGYQEWEFELLGVPFEERGRRMDEYMDAMIELWTADEPEFEGEFVSFRDIVFDPKPRQQPFPLWLGGRTRAALRRIARIGHGWMSTTTMHAEFPELLEYIRSQPEFEANPRPLEVYTAIGERKMTNFGTHEFSEPPKVYRTPDEIHEQVAYLASLGITFTGAPLEGGSPEGDRPTSATDQIRRLEWFAAEILPDARKLGATAETVEA